MLNYTKLICNRAYLAYVLTAGLSFSSLLSLNAVLPFIIIKHLHVSPANYGWLSLIIGGGYLSGSFVGGIIAVKRGASFTIELGLILQIATAAMAIIVAGYLYNLPVVLIPSMLILFGVGLNLPIAAGGAMALFPQIAGSAAALLGATMFGVSAIFTTLAAHLSAESPNPLFIFLIALSCLTYCVITCIGEKKNV